MITTKRLLVIALVLLCGSAWRHRVRHDCPPHVLEFSESCGTQLNAGDFVTELPCYGLSVESRRLNSDVSTYPMIFDSSNPSGGDTDLGTPNVEFGGPGVGEGGSYGPGSNDVALNNLLIVSEDNDQSDPDDNGFGGELIFRFAQGVDVESLKVVDNEAEEISWVACYSGDTLTTQVPILGLGNNNVQTIQLECEDVTTVLVHFGSSGGVSDLKFSDADCKCSHCAGGVTDLRLRYDGEKPRTITIKQKNGQVVFNKKVQPGTSFSIKGTNYYGRFGHKLKVFFNGYYHTVIDTSCWKSIGVDSIFGDLTVLSGRSAKGGRLCKANNKRKRRKCKQSYCPPVTLDLSESCGDELQAGDEARSMDCLGLRFQALQRDSEGELTLTRPIIFDSSNPSGNDFDLGTPNQAFGGPGIGEGGASPEGLNDEPLGNLLIISEDGDTSDPDDNIHGGLLSFTFDHLVNLRSLKVVDNEADEESFVSCYAPGHILVAEIPIARLGNNNVQTLDLSECDSINAILVGFGGSGGVSDLVYDDSECECSECKGKLTDLVLRYDGEKDANVKIKLTDGTIIFNKKVGAGESFSLSGGFGRKIKIFVNHYYHKAIYTSCKYRIAAGYKYGDFTVVSGESSKGGNLCNKSYFQPRGHFNKWH